LDIVRRADLETYRCPDCNGTLALDADSSGAADAIQTGCLTCEGCRRRYPIANGVPRFVPSKSYADSFGAEWHNFPKTLLDADWQDMYRVRFFQTTGFPGDLHGQTVLEVGCGPGSFTGIILSTGARVFSSDLSASVDVCIENLRGDANLSQLSLSQANLEALPFAAGSFDKVLCLGVIQHCPDPARAFKYLCRYVKPGGEIVIDCYQREPFRDASWTYLIKHMLRVITRRMPHWLLFWCVKSTIGALYNVKAAINKIPLAGPKLQRLIPIGELKRRDWTPEQMKQIKSLNVFDMLSPKYDNPQSVATVRGWIAEENFQLLKCEIGQNGVNAKARRPLPLQVEP
jgi:2-polyprenyl-3-methyl-5-hydroxy-6-metoxy-1,4-benzoquinol methylase